PDQLDAITERVAEILAVRGPFGAPAELLTVAQAAELLGVRPKTVHNMLGDGRPTRHGARGRPLVARVDTEALARSDARQPLAQARRRRPQLVERTFTERAKGR